MWKAFALALLVAGVVAGSARAATLTAISASKNSDNSGDYSDNTDPRNQFESVVALDGTVGPTCFTAHYSSILALDVKPFGTVDTDVITSSFHLSFFISASPGEAWMLRVNSHRSGALTIHNDGGTYAQAEIYSSSATSNIGSLSALNFGTLQESNENDSGNDRNTDCSAGPATTNLCGVGPTTVTMDFRWQEIVVSHGGVSGGDEAAVRLGRAGALPNLTADDYPGAGSRNMASDGYFVSVCVEQPQTLILSAGYCSPLDGSSCTFTCNGKTTGCYGNNYRVHLTYYDKNNNVVTTTTTDVNNGSETWISSVTISGPCTSSPYSVAIWIEDLPGLMSGHDSRLQPRVPIDRTIVARAQLVASCGGSFGPVDQHIPAASSGALAASILCLLIAGALILRRSGSNA